MSPEPGWVRHAVLYHLYPLGFLGAERTADEVPEGEVRHRLSALEPWLDHAVSLGASGILLGPVFASRTHGYDTTDHLAVDRRLGDEADLVALFAAAHARGLRVVLDGVFNHVGEDFGEYRQALAEGPSSPAARWFRLRWPDPSAADGGGHPAHDDFEGHGALVALAHDEPAVAAHVEHVMRYWLERGADGWRLDAAYAVPPAFWAPVLTAVRAAHPDVYVVGEVIHGDYAGIVAASGMDAVTQYELWKATWSSLEDGNAWELAHALRRHAEFTEAFVPLTFVGNHDVTRIASRLSDPRHLDHALALLLTVPGTPCVYAGDEHGFTGVKEDRAGGDDAVRPAFPATPSELSPVGLPVLHRHQELVGLRRRHPWLHDAELSVRHVSNPLLVVALAPRAGAPDAGPDEGVLLVLSTDDAEVRWGLPADLPGALAAGPAALAAGTGSLADGGRTVVLPPHGWAVLTHP
ncbi:alpha-amylase family glycosyl hydrolase [Cellulomonas marina]|uniref:Glycosidase n=1 Tax=Cellulomonas marina TaxID=988821 RepID=A0A1I0WM30_9CELL|nr:alpha-amylase family glycosyl hydrolase [Cellulomonas marina]GIG27718.1 alpha-amylase [Cellulomonas marina]SFA89258.1 Glycosidase [Cellulomonas marina]